MSESDAVPEDVKKMLAALPAGALPTDASPKPESGIPNLAAAAEAFKAALVEGADPVDAAARAGLVFMPRVAAVLEKKQADRAGWPPTIELATETKGFRESWDWCQRNHATIYTSIDAGAWLASTITVTLSRQTWAARDKILGPGATPWDPVVGVGPSLEDAVVDLRRKGRVQFEAVAKAVKERPKPKTLEEAAAQIQSMRLAEAADVFRPYLDTSMADVLADVGACCVGASTMDANGEVF